MATETNNLKLNKPNKTDFYNIDLVNANIDKIDEAITGKADKKDIPTSLPANGGNADTVGNVGIDKILKTSIVALDNLDWNTVSVDNNTWYSYTTTTTNIPNPGGYGIVRRINTGNAEWYFDEAITTGDVRFTRYKINIDEWSKWNRREASKYLEVAGVDIFAYIDSLDDSKLPPSSTVTIRAFNCINSPLEDHPYAVDVSLSNGGDFVVDVTRLETREWYILTAREVHTNKIYTCGKRNNVWHTWSAVGDITWLPEHTDLEQDFLNTLLGDYEWSIRTVRIANTPSAPTIFGYDPANNDFYYTIYKMNHNWLRVIAKDVRTTREFTNSKLDGIWTGWIENVQTNLQGHIVARREQGGTQASEGGQIILEKPTTTNLANDAIIDVLGDSIRFFEGGGNYRGAYLYISECYANVGTKILTNKNIAVQSTAPSSPAATDVWIW